MPRSSRSLSLSARCLFPNRFHGRGPSVTCTNLLYSMSDAGIDCELHLSRLEVPPLRVPHRAALARMPACIPYRWVSKQGAKRAEADFLTKLKDGEIAYLWPRTSLNLFREVWRRGNPIVTEMINTRMSSAKRILDAEYQRIGLGVYSEISESSISTQEAKFTMVSGIFSPSPMVDRSLQDIPQIETKIMPTSYGTYISDRHSKPAESLHRPLRFLFVGKVCIRKAAHILLKSWAASKIEGELVLAGDITPEIKQTCADLMNRTDVKFLGFFPSPDEIYRNADVFVMPSLEEGDPLVTYEAASHALPIMASPMGAGRLGANSDCMIIVDPHNQDAMVATLRGLATSAELRAHIGERARGAVENYAWAHVGARRADQLRAHFA